MERHALFFDLDGTIMQDVNNLYPKSELMLKELKKEGHLCFVATGRGFSNIPDSIKNILDGFVTLTGASCIYHDQVIFRHTFPKEYIDKIAELSFSINAPMFLENDDRMDVLINDRSVLDKDVIDMRGFITQERNTIEEYKTADVDYCKLDTRMWAKEKFEELSLFKTKKMTGLDAGDGWYEISNGKIDKGTAIQELCKKIGQDIRRTICFGDSENDLGMFRVCGTSVAVASAPDNVKEKASIVLEGHNEEAVISVLKKLGLLKGAF